MASALTAPQLPAVPEEILRNQPQRWGRKILDDDTPLGVPRLIAFRHRDGRVEALYQTIENPGCWGSGFVIDDRGHFSGEHGLLTLTNSPYCPWEKIADPFAARYS